MIYARELYMTANNSVLLIGGPDAGKSNFVIRLGLAIDHGKGMLRADGQPDDLEYVQEGAEQLLGGTFVPRTSREVRSHIQIPVRSAMGEQAQRGMLIVPDCSGEEWMKIYRSREWSEEWDELISSSCGCLLFVRVESDQNVPALDWITCERLFGSPAVLPDMTDSASDEIKPPTQVVLTDWLQCLRSAFTARVGGAFRPRVGVVITAWDAVPAEQQNAGPGTYLVKNYPMLAQFVETNGDRFDFAVFGISILGGDLENSPEFRDEYMNGNEDPLERGYVWHALGGSPEQSSDLTLPVAWAMNMNSALVAEDVK